MKFLWKLISSKLIVFLGEFFIFVTNNSFCIMKKHNIILLLSFFVFIVFTSCTEDPRQVQYIPEGTASVIHVKSKDLIKANLKGKETASRILKGFRGYGIYNETFDMAMSALFEDSLKTGINKESNLMAYLILSEEFRNAFPS